MRTKIFLLLFVAILFAGCAKTSDVDALTQRVTALEQKAELTDADIAELKSTVNYLKSQQDSLTKRIAHLEETGGSATDIAKLKESLAKVQKTMLSLYESLFARIQSITVVPTYNDGSVRFFPEDTTVIRFEITPISAIKALLSTAGSDEFFTLQATDIETKATHFTTFDIDTVMIDQYGEFVNVYVEPEPEMPMESQLQARLKIEAFENTAQYVCKTSSYFPLAIEEARIGQYVHSCNDLVFFPATAPTVGKDGCIAYWHCKGCNKNYLDQAGTREVDELPFCRPSVTAFHRQS